MKIDNIYDFIECSSIDNIFLDVDGVILHSCQAMCDIINEKYGVDFKGEDVTTWNFNNLLPNFTDEEVEELFEDELFFDYVEFIDGVKDFIKKYEDRIIIITKARTNNFIQKRLLFDLNNLNVPIIPIPLNISKSIINMSNGVFIDDSTNNLLESNAKYKIQFKEYNDKKEREWQVGWKGLELYSWK